MEGIFYLKREKKALAAAAPAAVLAADAASAVDCAETIDINSSLA